MDDDTRAHGSGRWTPGTLVGHSIAPLFIVAVLVVIVPRFVQMFAELGIALPLATRVLCRVSLFLHAQWYLAPFVVVIAVAVDYGIYSLLCRHLGDRAGHVWLSFVIVCYLVYLGAIVILLFLPLNSPVNRIGFV